MRRGIAALSLATAGFGLGMAPAAAGGGGGCYEMTEGTGTAVELIDMCFTPSVLRVAPGTEVTWSNEDLMDHVVTGTGWGLDAMLAPGDRGSHRFVEAGAYPYTCHLHPGMNGVVLVGDAPAAPAATVDVSDAAPVADTDPSAGGTSPLGAGAVGAAAGLAAGVAGARAWPRRRPG